MKEAASSETLLTPYVMPISGTKGQAAAVRRQVSASLKARANDPPMRRLRCRPHGPGGQAPRAVSRVRRNRACNCGVGETANGAVARAEAEAQYGLSLLNRVPKAKRG